MKVVIVHNIIAPYRIPLFNLLGSSPGIDLTVLFMAHSERDRLWDAERLRKELRVPYRVLQGIHIPWRSTTIHFNPRLYSRLWELRPDVIIVTSLSAAAATCLIYRALAGTPVVSWWAGTSSTEAGIGPVKRAWRRILVPRIDAYLCYSRAAAEYLHGVGVPRAKAFVAGNVTFDVKAFHARVEAQRGQARSWRRERGVEDKTVLLTVGQLIARKNHLQVLRVVAGLKRSHPALALIVVGEGAERARIEAFASEVGLDELVLAGHVGSDEMPMYYAAADVFLHLTLRDHWSQAVNEAMAAGLPVVVSSRDHATELIHEGLEGRVVDPDQLEAVMDACLDLIRNSEEARAMGQRAVQNIASNDIHRALAVIQDCLTSVRPPISS
jgi:glycosyltransferase involved in cell wall biosynthesis